MRFILIMPIAAAMLSWQSTPSDLSDIAERAYIFAYPLVMMEETRGTMPVNQFTYVPSSLVPTHARSSVPMPIRSTCRLGSTSPKSPY